MPERCVTLADYFDIGVIVKPQGIKGEIRVMPVTDDPARFGWLDEVEVSQNGGPRKVYRLEEARHQPPLVILKLAGVNDRNAAERLTGGILQIPPEKALPLEEDEYYIRDLIGMDVWTEAGEKLGVLTEVLHTGANDVYMVKTPDKKEILIPAIKQCILSVQPAARRMQVFLPEGLRD